MKKGARKMGIFLLIRKKWKVFFLAQVVIYTVLMVMVHNTLNGYDVTPHEENMGVPSNTITNKPLITLFTTFKTKDKWRDYIYKNTINNWSLLRPWVKSILYYTPGETLRGFAEEHGWSCYQAPERGAAGLPVFRTMFLHAQNHTDTPFYGYANGDMLFDKGLVDTLQGLLRGGYKFKQVLIIGQRRNYMIKPGQQIRSLEEFQNWANSSQWFTPNAQDYFISTKNGYPWESIPDFVVGGPGYDNWIVVEAIVKGMATIDASATLFSLHQTGFDGDRAGRQNPFHRNVNYEIVGKKFDFDLGNVLCTPLKTVRDERQLVVLKERNVDVGLGRSKKCKKYYEKRNLSSRFPLSQIMPNLSRP